MGPRRERGSSGNAWFRNAVRRYRFIDYATQAYLICVGLLILLFSDDSLPYGRVLPAVHAAGMFALHALIVGHGAFPNRRLLGFLRHFYPILMYAAFYRECEALNLMIVKGYLDRSFIRLDELLCGFQPSVRFMEAFPYRAVSEFFYASYFSYYVMIGGVGVALFLQNRERFFRYVAVISFVFYICFTAYIFLPVVGPPIFFVRVPGFPGQASLPFYPLAFPPSVRSGIFFHIMQVVYKYFEGHGAAFPSSHVAVAVCTLYFTWRYLPRIRYLHLAAVISLCLSTVYCRYHYAVDVPAGLLTAVVFLPLGEYLYSRTPGRG